MGKYKYEWDTIEREYRTNQFTDSELSRRHGCSRTAIQKRVKKGKWTRDLSREVRQTTNAKLVREDAKVAARVAGCNLKEKEEVELASETRVSVLRSHRKDISAMQVLENKLLEELLDSPTKLYMTQYKGKIIKAKVGIAVTEKAAALNNLANVQHKRIQLERQAFNLNDGDDSDDEKRLIDILNDIDGTTKGIPNSNG